MLIYCSAWKQIYEMSNNVKTFFLIPVFSPLWDLIVVVCGGYFFGIIACWIIMLRVMADFSWTGFSFPLCYAVAVDICSFTLDEFAQSINGWVNSHFWSTFTYWNFFFLTLLFEWHLNYLLLVSSFLFVLFLSGFLLLGKIHVALLKLLISDVEAEISKWIFFPTFEHILQFSCLLHLVSIKQCRLIFFPTLFLLVVLKLYHDRWAWILTKANSLLLNNSPFLNWSISKKHLTTWISNAYIHKIFIYWHLSSWCWGKEDNIRNWLICFPWRTRIR